MSQYKKLQSIIEYAIKRGYTNELYKEYGNGWVEDSGYIDDGRLEHLIFSHLFLKAFFGEKIVNHCLKEVTNMGWRYGAQQLVIITEEQRIDYLYDFIKEHK